MIYFNEYKQPSTQEIENPIATIDDETWALFEDTDKWDIIDGVFTDISQTPKYISRKQMQKEGQIAQLQYDIEQLEKEQSRPMREISVGEDVAYAMGKLQTLNEQIKKLRQQKNSL